VNGSPTEDFIVGKGLRQGDPLSPFLFLIVAEGLSGLMRKAMDGGLFRGYSVSNNILFHTLQFADDTIIVGEGIRDNLWTIKTVLRSFELVSGLKVNFFKSKLYGINLDDDFLRAASVFLHCGVDSIPFKFLGIPVGANPRRKATWSTILDSMKRRLSSWNGRHLSIGGRLTLINSVLSSLPLYFFSFYKSPKSVILELVRLQRNFLWGGGMEGNKMCWVSWDRICQPKEKGGLGIKNLELFNDSLLCKWKWRCLVDREAPWYHLLQFRYGSLAGNLLRQDGRIGIKKASIWWRHIWRLGSEEDGGWFGSNISNKIGDGVDINFWKDKWMGTETMKDLFPDLFSKTNKPEGSVAHMGRWNGDVWQWKFDWNEELTATEIDNALYLLSLLHSVQLRRNERDSRRWVAHPVGSFTVQSTYMAMMNNNAAPAVDQGMSNIFKKLWLNNAPSKVTIFGWRLLLDKLPTREALFKKGIITNNHDRSCIFCLREVEESHHVFFNCNFSRQVWRIIFRWMKTTPLAFVNIHDHFSHFGKLIKGGNGKKFRHIIWLATTWSLWKKRNNIIFRGEEVNIPSLVDHIIYFAWFWFIGRGGLNVNVTFSDWCNDPLACIQSV
jgi:hypothetical protein